jgi:glutathione S-transferase
VRWALDYKGIPFTPRNLLPGGHLRVTKKLAPRSCVPIIVDGANVIQDSTAIISYLDEHYPHRSLTPQQRAKESIEWEEYLDEEVGITLRLLFYYHVLPDRQRALRFLLEGAPWYGPVVLTLIFPILRCAMRRNLNISAVSARRSEERFLSAAQRLDNALQDRQFLVGEHFSRADLTACALLWPFFRPNESDAQASVFLPPEIMALRAKHKSRRYFSWVAEIYDWYRRPASFVSS